MYLSRLIWAIWTDSLPSWTEARKSPGNCLRWTPIIPELWVTRMSDPRRSGVELTVPSLRITEGSLGETSISVSRLPVHDCQLASTLVRELGGFVGGGFGDQGKLLRVSADLHPSTFTRATPDAVVLPGLDREVETLTPDRAIDADLSRKSTVGLSGWKEQVGVGSEAVGVVFP